jgi:hypothetical protein
MLANKGCGVFAEIMKDLNHAVGLQYLFKVLWKPIKLCHIEYEAVIRHSNLHV